MEDLETELIKAKIKWLEADARYKTALAVNRENSNIPKDFNTHKVEWHDEQIQKTPALEKEDLPW